MSDAAAFERCVADGGVVVFPSDTVYGLACDPLDTEAVTRLYGLKGRAGDKPSAVMFFELDRVFEALPELGDATRVSMRRLLPGGLTLLLPNPARRFPLACGRDPVSLGIRVPRLGWSAGIGRPVLQSSANLAGGDDPRRLEEVPAAILRAADLVIDGGAMPGTSSTVVDLRSYEEDGSWSVIREGAVGEEELRAALSGQFHFRPETYLEDIRDEVTDYDRLQDELVTASGSGARRILELGTGTGETAVRLLAGHPDAKLVGVDASDAMLREAGRTLPAERVELRVGRLQDPLPEGPFDLVASALAIHHLDAAGKSDLFKRVRAVLSPDGRFVLADVVIPADPREARAPLTEGFDKPSPVSEQLRWLTDAGLNPSVVWESGDLAVIAARTVPEGNARSSQG